MVRRGAEVSGDGFEGGAVGVAVGVLDVGFLGS